MKPYNEEFILNTVSEYSDKIKECTIGRYKIEKKEIVVDKVDGYLYERDLNKKIKVIDLVEGENILMRLSHKEIEGSFENINMARGRVGIVGLGLGYVVQEMAKNQKVSEIIVYEKSQEVIDMYNSNFEQDEHIKIICKDAYEAEREKFDYFYSDIYGYELSLKVVEDYKIFNELHEIEEYTFFGVEHFLLGCSYNEIIYVYVPENWMVMCKTVAASLECTRYIEYYKPLDEDFVSNLLKEFKVILNEGEE